MPVRTVIIAANLPVADTLNNSSIIEAVDPDPNPNEVVCATILLPGRRPLKRGASMTNKKRRDRRLERGPMTNKRGDRRLEPGLCRVGEDRRPETK
jgi:hypothetical protein